MTDKRIRAAERAENGACAECGRRHIHKDDCPTLRARESKNDGTDPDKPPPPYAGGMLS